MKFIVVTKSLQEKSRLSKLFRKADFAKILIFDIDSRDLPSALSLKTKYIFSIDLSLEDFKKRNIQTHGSTLMELTSGNLNDNELINEIQNKINTHAVKTHNLILIGASTGGPTTISDLLSQLNVIGNLPIVIVIHMPSDFVPLFVKHLQEKFNTTVAIPSDGENVQRAAIWVAPGDMHLELRASDLGVVFSLNQSPPVHSCRPSVDVFFSSASKSNYIAGSALLLTGIGVDGAIGAGDLRKSGWNVYIQDKESATVWGMPGAAFRMGHFTQVLNITQMAQKLNFLYAKIKAFVS